MRIVVPVSSFDSQTAPNWVKVVKHLRCGRNHALHLVYPRSAEALASSLKDQLIDEFDDVNMHLMESEPLGGWPFGPNTQFHACATFMQRDNPRIPWLMNEFDCLPTRTNSWDLIASRYANAAAPFFGKVSPTFWRDDNGKISSSLLGKDDVTMSGNGVYPGDMLTRRHCASLMADLMKGFDESTGAPPTGYDVHLRFAIRREGVADAGNVIADNWNTINYRIEGNKIVCDANPDHEIYRQHPNFEIRQTNKPIGFEALLIHGCKDASLAELILNDAIPLEANFTKPVETSQIQSPVNDALQEQIEAMRIMMQKQQELIADLLQKQAQPEEKSKPIKPKEKELQEIRDEVAAKIEERKDQPNISFGDVVKYVESKGKAVRMNELAREFNVNSDFMNDFVAKTPGLKMAGPPVFWVSIA